MELARASSRPAIAQPTTVYTRCASTSLAQYADVMKIPAIERLLSSGSTNLVREAWDRLQGLPGGKRLFSTLVGRTAPYTGSMGARVEVVREGFSRVVLPDRPHVRNHLRSIHAVALCNLAELTGNVAVAYSMPDDARFIVAGLEIEYVKKARGAITGECNCEIPQSNERCEFAVPVVMRDHEGDVVAKCTLRTLVGPKKKSSSRP